MVVFVCFSSPQKAERIPGPGPPCGTGKSGYLGDHPSVTFLGSTSVNTRQRVAKNNPNHANKNRLPKPSPAPEDASRKNNRMQG